MSHCQLNAFCPDQLRLLQGLCAHVAVAVHNARRFGDEREQRERLTREADEARLIQQALLPRSSPLVPGFRVSGLSIAAGSVGGDWYDFIPLRDGRWGLVLADVSGKGTAAALLMSATRGMLRSLAQSGSGPAEVLTRLNNMMVEDFPSNRFVTMVYAELDPSTRSFADCERRPFAAAAGRAFRLPLDRSRAWLAAGNFSQQILGGGSDARRAFANRVLFRWNHRS